MMWWPCIYKPISTYFFGNTYFFKFNTRKVKVWIPPYSVKSIACFKDSLITYPSLSSCILISCSGSIATKGYRSIWVSKITKQVSLFIWWRSYENNSIGFFTIANSLNQFTIKLFNIPFSIVYHYEGISRSLPLLKFDLNTFFHASKVTYLCIICRIYQPLSLTKKSLLRIDWCVLQDICLTFMRRTPN